MQILIKESGEVITLSINKDPTDSLIAHYTGNSEFEALSDADEAKADYQMAQEDADWWTDAIDNINLADHLEGEYKALYGDELVDAVLNRYYQASEVGEVGANKIAALNSYFKNDPTTHHEIKSIEFLQNESGFVDCGDGSYDFSICVTVTDVLIDDFNGDYELSDTTLVLVGHYTPNEDFEVIYGNSWLDQYFKYASVIYGKSRLDQYFKYASDLARESKTNDGVPLFDAMKALMNKKIAESK